MQTVTIPTRFNGPPLSANGGFACGTVARFVEGAAAEVTLRSPPPLGEGMAITVGDDGTVEMHAGETLVAQGRPIEPLWFEPPVRPTVEEATDAQTRHPWLGTRHILSDCFVCGPEREGGMRMCFGPLAAHPEINGALLSPTPDLAAGEDGMLSSEILWAALDCPSYTPSMYEGGMFLLGRLAAEILRPAGRDEELVAVGWPVSEEGRKHRTRSALLARDGSTVARADALWIRPRAATG